MRLVTVTWLAEGSTYPVMTTGWLDEGQSDDSRLVVGPHLRADTGHMVTDGPFGACYIDMCAVQSILNLGAGISAPNESEGVQYYCPECKALIAPEQVTEKVVRGRLPQFHEPAPGFYHYPHGQSIAGIPAHLLHRVTSNPAEFPWKGTPDAPRD